MRRHSTLPHVGEGAVQRRRRARRHQRLRLSQQHRRRHLHLPARRRPRELDSGARRVRQARRAVPRAAW